MLGISNAGEAVGFYVDAAGNSHGYLYNIATHRFVAIKMPGSASVTGAGINNKNAVVGFFNQAAGMVKAFYITQGTQSRVRVIAFPGADLTQAFGVNDHGEVVGAYTIGAQTFGFTWTVKGHFRKVNDPQGKGTHGDQRHQQRGRPGRVLHQQERQHARDAGHAVAASGEPKGHLFPLTVWSARGLVAATYSGRIAVLAPIRLLPFRLYARALTPAVTAAFAAGLALAGTTGAVPAGAARTSRARGRRRSPG